MNIEQKTAIALVSFIALIILNAVLSQLTNDKAPAGTYVAKLLQASADEYALNNGGKCARSFRDLYPFFPGGSHQIGGKAGALPLDPFVRHAYLYFGPPQEETSAPHYIVDLPPMTARALFDGATWYLDDLRKPGCFGYGTTTDQKKFVIVCFQPDGVPLYDSGSVMVMTNHETLDVMSDFRCHY